MRWMIIYGLLLISIVQQLCAMKNLISNEKHVDECTLWNVIVSQSLLNDDYDTYRKIAVLSTAYNTFIETGYRPKKKLLDKFREENKNNLSPVTGYVSWNKDFSKCAWATISEKDKTCTLTMLAVNNAHKIIQQNSTWYNFYFPVFEDNICPFFNEQEHVYLHGYGYNNDHYSINSVYATYGYCSIFEYILDAEGAAESRRCLLEIEEGYIPFSYIFNFPLLLKALLKCTSVHKSEYSYSDLLSYYDINHIIIPENYTVFKQHVGWKNILDNKIFDYERYKNIGMYDDLPSNLKQAIEKRYKEQLGKK